MTCLESGECLPDPIPFTNERKHTESNFPYIRIVGKLEQFRNGKIVDVQDIKTVSDPYEPYFHVLHAIHDTIIYERGPPVSLS